MSHREDLRERTAVAQQEGDKGKREERNMSKDVTTDRY